MLRLGASVAFVSFGVFLPWTGHAEELVTVPARIAHYPDVVVYNAKIVTMDDKCTRTSPGSVVEAMAVRDGKILALGKTTEILPLAGPLTRRVDVKGRTVIPGIIDAHTHIHNRALDVWLRQHPDKAAEAVAVFEIKGENFDELRHNLEVVLRERSGRVEKGKWIFVNLPDFGGRGVGTYFLHKRAITIKDLDKLAPDNPIVVVAHPSYMVNSKAKSALKEMYGFEPPEEEVDEEGFAILGVVQERTRHHPRQGLVHSDRFRRTSGRRSQLR